MAKLLYNDSLDQMELTEESGKIETQFIVPPQMKDGDTLTPFMFKVFRAKTKFFMFGRYNEPKDMAQFVLAGPPGYKYKIAMADGNSPYGWKVKKHGLTRSTAMNLGFLDKVIGLIVEKFLVMVGKEASPDYFRDIIQADAFAMEELIGLPMAMLRVSEREGVMDSKEKCIGPWCFYGPSLPAAFCRCRLKLIIYPPAEKGQPPNKKGPSMAGPAS